MNRILLTIVTILISNQSVGAEFESAEMKRMELEYCNRPAIEVEIQKDIYEVGLYGDLLVTILSGNTQEAVERLGSKLGLQVLMLHNLINSKPCNVSKETLGRIYYMLRVIAAVNQITPIPKLDQYNEGCFKNIAVSNSR